MSGCSTDGCGIDLAQSSSSRCGTERSRKQLPASEVQVAREIICVGAIGCQLSSRFDTSA
jgi:hypothetical protein